MEKSTKESVTVEVVLDTRKFVKQQRGLRQEVERTTRVVKSTGSAPQPEKTSRNFLKTGKNIHAGLRIVADGLEYAAGRLDEVTRIRRLLANARDISGVDGITFDQVRQTAADANLDRKITAEALVALAAASKPLALLPPEIGRLVTSIADLLRLDGSGNEDIRAALGDLTKVLQTGDLAGKDFQAFLSSAPQIGKALADEFGISGQQRLLALVADGEVSIERFIRAINNAVPGDGELIRPRDRTFDELAGGLVSGIEGQVFGSELADLFADTLKSALIGARDLLRGGDAAADAAELPPQRPNRAAKSDLVTSGTSRPDAGAPAPAPTVVVPDEALLRELLRLIGRTLDSRPQARPETDSAARLRDNPSDATALSVATQREQVLRRLLELLAVHTRLTREQTAAATDYVSRQQNSQDLLARQSSTLRAALPVTQTAADRTRDLARSHGELATGLGRSTQAQSSFAAELSRFDTVARESLKGFINDLRQGKTSTEALLSVLGRIEDRLVDITLNALFSGAGGGPFIGLIGGLGRVFGFRDGGLVKGPGTGSSDSIVAGGPGGPVRISNGEFIVRAEATRRHLKLLRAINDGDIRLPQFADGGTVGAGTAIDTNPRLRISAPATPGRGHRQSERPQDISFIVVSDEAEALRVAAAQPRGRRTLINFMRENRNAIGA